MLSQLSYSYALVRGGAQTHDPLVPKRISLLACVFMVHHMGLEPMTPRLKVECSIPTELMVHIVCRNQNRQSVFASYDLLLS